MFSNPILQKGSNAQKALTETEKNLLVLKRKEPLGDLKVSAIQASRGSETNYSLEILKFIVRSIL